MNENKMNEVSVKDFRMLSEKLDSVNRKIDIIAERQTRIEKMLVESRVENENISIMQMIAQVCILDKIYNICNESDIIDSTLINLKGSVIIHEEKMKELQRMYGLDSKAVNKDMDREATTALLEALSIFLNNC